MCCEARRYTYSHIPLRVVWRVAGHISRSVAPLVTPRPLRLHRHPLVWLGQQQPLCLLSVRTATEPGDSSASIMQRSCTRAAAVVPSTRPLGHRVETHTQWRHCARVRGRTQRDLTDRFESLTALLHSLPRHSPAKPCGQRQASTPTTLSRTTHQATLSHKQCVGVGTSPNAQRVRRTKRPVDREENSQENNNH